MTENGLDINAEELEQLLTSGDIVTIGFLLFPERLLVDTRVNEREGQLARMVEPVASVQERYLWLGKHRSSFGAPEGFSFFVWPRSVRNLLERDALAPLKRRLEPEALAAFESALEHALRMERDVTKAMIRGHEAWPAIWERSAA